VKSITVEGTGQVTAGRDVKIFTVGGIAQGSMDLFKSADESFKVNIIVQWRGQILPRAFLARLNF